MPLATVLLVDDDPEIHALLKAILSTQYALFSVETLKAARDFLDRNTPDLILLDDELPDGRGLGLFEYLRKDTKTISTPTLMLTKKHEVSNKVVAFDLGADDYITKPFEPLEVLARIQLRLKNKNTESTRPVSTRYDDLELDIPMGKAFLYKNEAKEEIDMTPIEFKILYLLANKKGGVLSRKQILEEVWGDQQHVIERTVDQHVSKIRKKIDGCTYTVRSAHGRGYAFVKNLK